jgi:hypothetical protein
MFKKIVAFILLVLCVIPSIAYAAFKLPDSGQTKCYQTIDPYAEIPCTGTGQDGAYNINPMSYTDNDNGTVTDNNTGLMWQKQDDDNTFRRTKPAVRSSLAAIPTGASLRKMN